MEKFEEINVTFGLSSSTNPKSEVIYASYKKNGRTTNGIDKHYKKQRQQ